MHLRRLLVGFTSTCSRSLLAHQCLVRNAHTTIKSRQTSGLCQVTMSKIEPDSIFQSKETSDDASLDECFPNSTNNGEKEDGALGDELGLGGSSEPKNLKETQGHESGESGASKKSVAKQESGKKNRKRGRRVDSEPDAEKTKKKKQKILRPNYFVSIPITNAQISSAVTEVQEAVLEREPRLAKAMIPVPTLHITLLVTHLADQEQVDLAAAALAQVESSLAELLDGAELVLPFTGVAHFRNDVVFVALGPGPHRRVLCNLAELLRGHFKERGLLEGDAHGFEPHLTIMKLSRAPKLRSQGIKRVDPSLYSNYNDRFFGDQTLERLDLCSMLKRKQQDGYYHTETSLQLGSRRRSEPDEAELLRISKRLVEDAVSRAVQQYKKETFQNGGAPNAGQPPGNADATAETKTTDVNAATDTRK
ncbi:A-kinase anchor protein 7 isoform X2 [Hippocampus zosterae]|uniref:A-kinase anchor protein 7 isoform X2 n=1 Tax=Hippocampus zosterae TaxID=109293 RepID=UPI00223E1DCD|nr:A-kinase anchor protein 7 isoform X2 [Hippocampus zosterae]